MSRKTNSPRRYRAVGNAPVKVPKDWDSGPGDHIYVSYTWEQRVLAVIAANGGQIVRTRSAGGSPTTRISKLLARPVHQGTILRAIHQLANKGIIYVDFAQNTDNPKGKRILRGVYLVDGEKKADKWAMDELYEVIRHRSNGSASKEESVPDSYEPVRPGEKVVVPKVELVPAEPVPSVSNGEFDAGAVADKLLAKVLEIVANPPAPIVKPDPELQAKYEEARKHAYDLENKYKALLARLEQADKNTEALLQGAKEQAEQIELLKSRLRKFQQGSREHNIRELLDNKSREALDRLKRGTL